MPLIIGGIMLSFQPDSITFSKHTVLLITGIFFNFEGFFFVSPLVASAYLLTNIVSRMSLPYSYVFCFTTLVFLVVNGFDFVSNGRWKSLFNPPEAYELIPISMLFIMGAATYNYPQYVLSSLFTFSLS